MTGDGSQDPIVREQICLVAKPQVLREFYCRRPTQDELAHLPVRGAAATIASVFDLLSGFGSTTRAATRLVRKGLYLWRRPVHRPERNYSRG